MIRLFVAAILVCALMYVLFPRDFEIAASRVGGTVRGAVTSVVGAARSAGSQKH